MDKDTTWFALVGLRVLDGNEHITNSNSAYVNIAQVASNLQDFIAKIQRNLAHHKFEVFELEDIVTEEALIKSGVNDEQANLLAEIKEGYLFAWGTFHTFDT